MKEENTAAIIAALARATAQGSEVWQPRIFELGHSEQRTAFEQLVADVAKSGALHVHDEIDEQVRSLVETRNPRRKLGKDELSEAARAHLGGVPLSAYGCWVYYPWSQRLVHVLPRHEFRELRTSRNRNKITTSEQERLSKARLGVVGLSVGQATALTLALEGNFGHLRLADFDRLDLSNMNRLRAGVHELNVPKTVMTARAIFELDPYADLSVFPEGITAANIDRFLEEGGNLDLVFDECDDLFVKVLIREKARALRIPVLMETSDRGLIDIERFDLEPERPLFHGVAGTLDPTTLTSLTMEQKIPIVLKILGGEQLSKRVIASLFDVETTLKTWPQLASAVALGGAVNTDSARRILLGQLQASGRFYVDLQELVSGAADAAHIGSSASEVSEPRSVPTFPPIRRVEAKVTPADISTLVAHAMAAPSGGNCQPWHFIYEGHTLSLVHEFERSTNYLDFDDAATHVAFGAAIENVELVASKMGLATRITLFPDAKDARLVASIELERAPQTTPDALVEQVALRCSNRRLGPRTPLSNVEKSALASSVDGHMAALRLVDDASSLEVLKDVLGKSDRLRMLSETMHREMFAELRFSKADAERTRDGIDIVTLEATPADVEVLNLLSSWSNLAEVKKIGEGAGLGRATEKAVASASAIGIVTVRSLAREDRIAAGRSFQRVWLKATELGLALQPLAPLAFFFLRAAQEPGSFADDELETLQGLRARFDSTFELSPGETPLMIFRLAHAGAPTARSLRRTTESALEFR